MKYSLGISNFVEEISRLPNSIISLYFFALTAEEGLFLKKISPCYFLDLCSQMGMSFLFSFAFNSLLFSAICKASSDNHFCLFAFLFLGDRLDPCLLTISQTFLIFDDLDSFENCWESVL